LVTSNTCRLIGYWYSINAPQWPDPLWFVDESQDPEIRAQVVAYLRAGTVLAVAGGINFCRFCRSNIGYVAQSDGYYYWHGELAHYVQAHAVRLPDEFVQHVLANRPALSLLEDDFSVDESWWRSQTGWHDGSSVPLPPIWSPDSSLYLTHITRPLSGAQLAFLRRVFPLHGLSTAELLERLRPENLPWDLGKDLAYHRAGSLQEEAGALGISLEFHYQG